MINLKKNLFLVLFLILVISISACGRSSGSKKSIEEIRTGTQGISVAFLPNNPPDVVHAEPRYDTFDITMELRNNGAYPQPDENNELGLNVYLSGFDPNILQIKPKDRTTDIISSLQGKALLTLMAALIC